MNVLTSVKEKKDLALGYALWCLSLVGICGVQRMYLGQVGPGILLLFTFGFCGVGQLLDLLLLPGAVRKTNQQLGFSDFQAAASLPLRKSNRTSSMPQDRIESDRFEEDDDLKQLLLQAEKSVSRIDISSKSDSHGR